MNLRKKFTVAIAAVAISITSVLSFAAMPALENEFKGASAAKAKPRVVVIKAEWCSACQKLDPTMMELMKEYGDRLDFIVLDVTNEESTAKSAAKAKSLGLTSFFEANKKMTSTVAVFKGKSMVFKTAKNFDRDEYVRAFEKALR
jgi:thiol-disulfide isomerase/thioredoxin